MGSQMHDKSAGPKRQGQAGEPTLEPSMWFAPFRSETFLSLQNIIGNRVVNQLLQADMGQQRRNGNGNGHKLVHPQLRTAPATIQTKPQEGEQQAGGATERQTTEA